MRRVVVNGRFLAQARTGVQRYGAETLRALDRLLGRWPQYLYGTCWQLALPIDARDVPLVDNFEIHTLQFLRGHAWEQVSLAAFARGAYLVNPSYSGPLFKRRQTITVHDAAVRASPETYSLGYRAFNNLCMGLLAPRADTLMTVSHFSAQELKKHYALARNDIVVGRLGWEHVGATQARCGDAEVLRRHGLASGAYLFAVGSPKPSKNFGLMPRALALLGSDLSMPLAVAGARDARIYRRDESIAHDKLRLLGFVPDDELDVLYRHAAWFIFPSLYEGFGLPPHEAMANGCPVLAARAASIPEVCGKAALYFDPHDPASLADCIRKATLGPDAAALREMQRERGAERLAFYTWEANAEILLNRLVAVGAVAAAPPGAPRASMHYQVATPPPTR